jgi:flagellar hook-basal body complex protein FliE
LVGLKVEDIENYLGKPVNDPYGRRVGHIVSFYSDPDGNVVALEISFGDFEFKEVSIDRFNFDSGEIILVPEWEYEAKKIENRLERLKKRVTALEDLYAKKEIPRHTYEVFKKKLDEALVNAKEESKKVKDLLKKRQYELEDIILELEKAMTSLKVSYIAGEVPDKAYKTAADQIRKHIEHAQLEKESVKKHLEKIEVLETQPVDIGVSTNTSEEKAPEQNQSLPVVVLES